MLRKNKVSPNKTDKKPTKIHFLKHPFMVPVITFMVFFFVAMLMFINFNGQTVGASDSRIVMLTINGQTKVIPTTAPTVGDLLNRLNITVNKGDVVEPALTTAILDNDFQINIYRVHPVTVVENGVKTVINTADQDPKQIAKDAGYTLYPQDNVSNAANADNLSQNIVGAEVNIDPAIPVTLNLYGSTVQVRTHAKTVGELLTDDKIATNSGNNVLPALNTAITPGLQILVVPVGQHLISTQQVIPFDIQRIKDPTIPYGTSQITQAGVNGIALVVQDISDKNGQALNSAVQQVIVVQPVTEIIRIGTGISAIAGGDNISWLKSSVINVNDYSFVNEIVNRESHWNPDDINGSGCIGLGQSCGSPPGLAVVCPDWENNAVCQLNFFNSYANGRYGSWANAAYHENSYGWW